MDRWEKDAVDSGGFPVGLLRSQEYRPKAPDPSRVLPFVSMPTAAFLWRLATWAYAGRRCGGLADDQEKERVALYLKSLLTAVAQKPFKLTIYFDNIEGLSFDSVVGFAGGSYPVQLSVDGGEVDANPMVLAKDPPLALQTGLAPLCLSQAGRVALDKLVEAWADRTKVSGTNYSLATAVGKQVIACLAFLAEETVLDPPNGCGLKVDDEDIDWTKDSASRNKAMVGYWMASQALLTPSMPSCMSAAVDMSRVGGLNIMNVGVLAPGNEAAWMPPQVVPDFVGERTLLQYEHGGGPIPKAKDYMIKDEYRKRFRAWVGNKGDGSWRPKKRFRVASFKWCVSFDHALEVGCGIDGLKQWAIPEGDPDTGENVPPLQWPRLSLCCDSGGDAFCSHNFLVRKLGLNIDFIPDLSHGCHRDFQLAVKRAGLWPHELLMMLVYNNRHGEWDGNRKFVQAREAMTEFFADHDHTNDPLWQALLPALARDRGEEHRLREEDYPAELSQSVAGDAIWTRKGDKCNLNRFMGALREARREDPVWHARYLANVFVCVECDLMKGARLMELLPKLRNDGHGQAEEEEHRAMRVPGEMENAISKNVSNVLVTTTLMLGDAYNQLRQRLIVRVCDGWERWHSKQNKKLRSSGDSIPWLVSQLKGEYDKATATSFQSLQSADDLNFIGLAVEGGSEFDNFSPEDIPATVANEHAAVMGTLACALACCRVTRNMWMCRGWAGRSVLLLDLEERADTLREFREDYERFLVLTDLTNAAARRRYHRSIFRLGPVRQLTLALETTAWHMTRELETFLTAAHSRFLGTQVVEDAFNSQRHQEKRKQDHKPPPASLYAALIGDRVLSRRHHFKEAAPSMAAAPERACKLPAKAFQKSLKVESVKLHKIIGTTQKADWYTCPPANHAQQFSDLEMCKWADSHENGWHRLDQNLGFLLTANSQLLIRKVDTEEWYFVLGNVKDSACPVWPAAQGELEGGRVFYLPAQSGKVHWVVLCDHLEWETRRYQWYSPLYQYLRWPECRARPSSWQGVRAFAVEVGGTTNPMPLLKMAANMGFFSLGIAELRSVAKIAGFGEHLESGMDLFAILMMLVTKVLGCGEARAIDILAGRLAKMHKNATPCCEELLMVDEALAMMGKDQADEIRAAKKKADSTESGRDEFVKKYREVRQRVAPAAPAGGGGHGGGRGRGGKGGKRGGNANPRMLELPEGHIWQQAAKGLLPPESHIWRNLVRGGWQSQFRDYPRTSASWSRHGEREALLINLRACWSQYLERDGLDHSHCRVSGLFS